MMVLSVQVSSEGIRIVEQTSRDILAMVWLQDIVYTTEVKGKKNIVFSIIAKNIRQNRRLVNLKLMNLYTLSMDGAVNPMHRARERTLMRRYPLP